MDYLASLLGYFGLSSASVTPEQQDAGKRRTVLYLTFISFVLMIVGCASTDWVLGGIEFGNDLSLPTSQAHFHVGLTMVEVEAYIYDIYVSSPNPSNAQSYNNVNTYKRKDYLARAAIQNSFVASTSTLPANGPTPNPSHPGGACVRGEADWVYLFNGEGPNNYWCGTGVTKLMNNQIDDAYGLMVVACLLGGVAWVLITMVNQGSTALVGRKYAYEAVAGVMVASALFALCSVGVFDASGIKKAFCNAFDPDASFGTYCGYYDGFFAAIASVVLMLFTAGLFWFWMPHDTAGSGASYAFTDVGAKPSGGFTEFGSSSEAASSSSSGATAPASGYQGFGSASQDEAL